MASVMPALTHQHNCGLPATVNPVCQALQSLQGPRLRCSFCGGITLGVTGQRRRFAGQPPGSDGQEDRHFGVEKSERTRQT